MAENFADRLTDAIVQKRAPVVVALDPVLERLPEAVRAEAGEGLSAEAALRAIVDFAEGVIDEIAPVVPAVKINIAYFEPYRGKGVDAYFRLARRAQERGLLVIGDVKRGDVGHSAEMYARGQLAPSVFAEWKDERGPDAVTVSGYLGLDGVQPFIDAARETGRGVFVLVRTSNPSAATIQDALLGDGRKVHELMAGLVSEWAGAAGLVGRRGQSAVGAVVATRDGVDAARLRALMPRSVFLVPGYGAQGGTAEDVRPYFHGDGTGAIIAAGRSVIFAHGSDAYRQQCGDDWRACVRREGGDFARDLAGVAFGGGLR